MSSPVPQLGCNGLELIGLAVDGIGGFFSFFLSTERASDGQTWKQLHLYRAWSIWGELRTRDCSLGQGRKSAVRSNHFPTLVAFFFFPLHHSFWKKQKFNFKQSTDPGKRGGKKALGPIVLPVLFFSLIN